MQALAIDQNPREVATKFGKSIDTFFFKSFPEAKDVLQAWTVYLENEALYGPDDPLFPATALIASSNAGFKADGFTRQP